jgi:hypothetical protein
MDPDQINNLNSVRNLDPCMHPDTVTFLAPITDPIKKPHPLLIWIQLRLHIRSKIQVRLKFGSFPNFDSLMSWDNRIAIQNRTRIENRS